MRHLPALFLLIFVATPVHAQEYNRNAWGLIAAPMSYHLTSGDEFEVNESNTSLDFGLFYSRFFTRSWSGRVEVFLVERDIDTFQRVAESTAFAFAYFSVEELAVQTDVVFDADRRIDLGGHEARFSIGFGLLLSGVYDQTISRPAESPRAGDPTAGTYMKWGWLAEGGMTLDIDDDFGVFARFRAQSDEDTFGQSDDADIVRELAAFGFHVGAELGF